MVSAPESGSTELEETPMVVLNENCGLSASSKAILIVGNDALGIEGLSISLAEDQYAVSVAQSGDEALECVGQGKFDLVLLDLELATMNLHALKTLRDTYSPTQLPVIVVIALSENESMIHALQQGANDYITKPINFPEMRARIRAQLLRGELTQQSEERYALAARGASDGLWDWNLETNRIYFSSRWKSMVGCAENEVSNHPDEWLKRVHPEDIIRLKQQISDQLEGVTSHLESQHRMLHKDGTYRWMRVRAVLARNGEKEPARMAGSHSDITHGKVADALTGLPNRALFFERLEGCLDRVKRLDGPMFAVLFLDIDRFKGINDRFGHPLGDQLLIAISRRLETCLRSKDAIWCIERESLLARLGGDEFTILLDDIRELSQATNIAERILKELGAPFDLDGNEVFTTASIGIALSDPDYEQAKDVLRDADTAMYQAKAQGKGRCEVFDTAMRDRVEARQRLEAELRRAVAAQEFVVHYQPIFSLGSGLLSGFEALIRWQHPTRGLLGPNEFIAVAEEAGLSLRLDQWVLRQATRQMKDWQARFPTHQALTISVNFSSRQFQQLDIVEQVSQLLRESGLDGSSLELEITETQMMENRESVSAVLKQLRALNIQLAIDDFGTGYSSLSYIQRFPVQRLKIDRTFVSRMCLDQEDRAIVQTIVALAHNLRLHLVAEGVETAAQLNQLKELGCEYAQGYFLSKPLDSSAAEHLIGKTETGGPSESQTPEIEQCPEEIRVIERLLSEIQTLEKRAKLVPIAKTREAMNGGSNPSSLEPENIPLDSQSDNEVERKQEELRLKDELEIHLEDVKKDAMDRFDQERYRECVGIFDFLSRLEPENQKWQQYLELSRQLVLETEPNCARSCEDLGKSRPDRDPPTIQVVPAENDSLADAEGYPNQITRAAAGTGALRMQPFPDSAPVAVASMELKNITSGGPAVEFAARHSGDRRRVLLLRIAACLMLAAFPIIWILHQTEKHEPAATGRLKPIPALSGNLKSSIDQFLPTGPENTRAEAQAGEGETKSAIGKGRPNGVSSPESPQYQRNLRYPTREMIAKADRSRPNRVSASNQSKILDIRNEQSLQELPRTITIKTSSSKLESSTPTERVSQVYSVIHQHVLGRCHGELVISGRSIAFIPSENSKDSFKSSVSEIVGIEVGDTLKIKFKSKTYDFKVNTRGKEANRAQVDAIYRRLTRFTT